MRVAAAGVTLPGLPALFAACTEPSGEGGAWQEDLGLEGSTATIRDLWAHRDLGASTDRFATTVGSHEAAILRVTPSDAP